MRRFLLSLLVLSVGYGSLTPPTAPADVRRQAPRSGTAARTLGYSSGFAPGGAFLALSPSLRAREMRAMAATGGRWLRMGFNWSGVEAVRGRYDWSNLDTIVSSARARGLKVLAVPGYTPGWARPRGTSFNHPPNDPRQFAAFLRAAVRHFSPRGVHAWEIWNEPNNFYFWAPRPNASAYARLLKLSYQAVRGADRSAVVVSGGLAPAGNTRDGRWISPVTFLQRIYANGARGSFDAVGMHPYSYPVAPTYRAPWNAFATVTPGLRRIMVAHGDGAKKVWGTEFGFATGTHRRAVTQDQQARWISEGFRAWRRWIWTGPLFLFSFRDSGTNRGVISQNFGLVRRDFSGKRALATFRWTMLQAS